MMPSNYDRLADVAEIAKAYDAPLRVNVYQSVRTDAFAPDLRSVLGRLLKACLTAPTSSQSASRWCEPWQAWLRGAAGVAWPRCASPRGRPCNRACTGREVAPPLDVLLDAGPGVLATKSFADARSVPAACTGCAYLAACRGGCAGRRRLMGALEEPDPYCPIVRGEERRLAIRHAMAREMPKLESACTTIVMARLTQ